MPSLIGLAEQAILEQAAQNVFDTFKRPLTVYVEAQTAFISTSPNYSRFGQHDQNVFNPAVNPNATVIMGCIFYLDKQPWQYIEPSTRTNYEQNKLRNSFGQVRIKVDSTGYQLLVNCKQISVDGFNFKLSSNARPHGVFGNPVRWTFFLDKLD